MIENPANLDDLSEDDLERLPLEASSLSGRRALARVTAIRTLLKRREQRPPGEAEANARRALELVNAARGPGEQLTEIDPHWAASIVVAPEWAELYRSDAEMQRATGELRERQGGRR